MENKEELQQFWRGQQIGLQKGFDLGYSMALNIVKKLEKCNLANEGISEFLYSMKNSLKLYENEKEEPKDGE